jgi:hypothetical protein
MSDNLWILLSFLVLALGPDWLDAERSKTHRVLAEQLQSWKWNGGSK